MRPHQRTRKLKGEALAAGIAYAVLWLVASHFERDTGKQRHKR